MTPAGIVECAGLMSVPLRSVASSESVSVASADSVTSLVRQAVPGGNGEARRRRMGWNWPLFAAVSFLLVKQVGMGAKAAKAWEKAFWQEQSLCLPEEAAGCGTEGQWSLWAALLSV